MPSNHSSTNKPSAERVGRNISTALAVAGLGKTDLARQLDIHVRTVYAWCAGQSMPREKFLYRTAEICGVSIDWLTNGSGEPDRLQPSMAPPNILGMHASGSEAKVLKARWSRAKEAWIMDVRLTLPMKKPQA